MMRNTRAASGRYTTLISLLLCYFLIFPASFFRQSVLAASKTKDTSATEVNAAAPTVTTPTKAAPVAAAAQAGQTPYSGTPIALPGTVYAKDFDNGGAGVAYHDTTAGNTGGEYRNTDVDICDNGGSSGVVVGWTKPGEWLEYTVNVGVAGTYLLIAQVSSEGAGGTFHIEFNGVNKTGALTIPDTGGWHIAQNLSKDGVSLSAGQQVMRISFDSAGSHNDVGDITSVRVVNTSTPQTPFKGAPLAVPGVIELEDFDNGGEAVAYHDTSAGNSGELYRTADVDIFDGYSSGQFYVWSRAGEWLEYTINVGATGSYAFIAEVSADSIGGGLHVEIDGANVTGTMAVPDTDWHMRTVIKTGVQLTAGQHVMRVVMDSNNSSGGVGDLNSIRVASEQAAQTPFKGAPIAVPGTVQAEDFDNGGELIAYADNTAGNSGGQYRPAENVDISAGNSAGLLYVWPQAGEWLEYTINAAQTSTYSFVAQWSIGDGAGGTYHIEIDGVNVTGTMSVPDTNWEWQTVTKSGVRLSAGQHVMRVVMDSNGIYNGIANFDSIRVVNEQAAQPAFGAKLVAGGAIWSYLDDGSDQGTDWRGITFDNSTWASGNAQLGYGDGDEKKVVGYGSDPNNKHITTYFRRSFHVNDPMLHNGLKLRLLRDDGAVVYLNGTEVFRSNMPGGEITSRTLAASDATSETDFWETAVDPRLLKSGTNVVAVEVHQAYVGSSDISFDLELIAAPIAVPGIVQAEDFDEGGEGISYHDTTAGNSGGKYRAADVDVYDGYGTSHHVGNIRAGEWLEYTINVGASSTYSFVAQWSAGDGPGGTYHFEIDGVNVTGTISVPDTDWHRRSVTKTGVQLTAGQHVMRVVMESDGAYGGVGDFHAVRIVDEQAQQIPFHGVPIPLPGVIQAEDFDKGGEGKAYADTTAGNDGERHRLDTDVDIHASSDAIYVWPTATEWLEYTVNVERTSAYSFITQWMTGDGPGGTYHFEVDGVNVTGPISVPDTNWDWGTVTKTGVQLTAGQHTLRMVFDGNGTYSGIGDLDSIRVVDEQAAHTPFRGTPHAIPGTIQMEDFDDGGEMKAYHDLTTGNRSGFYRDTDVDIDNDAGAVHIAFTQPGEWLKYTVNVNASGSYTLGVRLWSEGAGGTFHAEVDGVNVTGPISVADTAWEWKTVTKTGVNLTAGQHVVRFVIDSAGADSSFGAYLDSFTISNTATPANGKIVFASNRNGNNEIYSMNADGSNQLRLTSNTSNDIDPTVSPDGAKIAFTANRDNNNEIYSMNADGSVQARLTNNTNSDTDPAWSPDGTRIAFVSNRDGNNEIYVMYADGFGQTRITTNSASDTEPAWSPDGAKIAFVSNRAGNNEIYTINADGSGQARVTNNTVSDTEPFWSPNGTKIAFVSNRDGNNEIYTMNVNGSGALRLTTNTVNDDDPSWSPDGAKIAFMSARDGNNEIYTMSVNGLDQIRLTSNTANDHEPYWQAASSAQGPTPTPTPEATPTPTPTPLPVPTPDGTIIADVVAFDQVFFYNRLGALNPAGMIYALRRDVMPIDSSRGLVAGNVQLRPGKRARPLILRMNVGQQLEIRFQNLLNPNRAHDNQPATRTASVHVTGLQLVNSITDDGSNVGTNPGSLVAPGGTATYTYYAQREGNHLFYSTAATTGGEGDGGSLAMGLFGMVNVEPKGAEWYRSQVTQQELTYATIGRTPAGHPLINYDAVYPAGHPRAGQPVLRILQGNEIAHGDLNAIITGPNKGRFPENTYRSNPAEPDRNQPFREFSLVYHDEIKAVQAFPQFFEDPVLSHTLHSVRDAFAINYGTGGIGSEILANRLGVGPMRECVDCLYEEFFLSSWTVGDPAQIVDVPANTTDGNGNLVTGAKATKVFFPEDPSNVYHGYLNDHTKMRITHAGPKEHHIHHLHAHQWFHTPDSDNSTVLDSQAFGPGFSFTTEILHGGGGNRGKTVGDSIFHCHFYPHFAMGMWGHWRVHDVFEEGTPIDGDGRPAPGSRALPDGEISRGTPIPAVVPIPTLPMPPMPQAQVSIVNGQAQVAGAGNPGFPFFVPGVAGHRPPHPPLDTVDDGGLPRHIITGGVAVHHKEHLPQFDKNKARLDFDKSLEEADARAIPEQGTPVEQAAMNFHAQRQHQTFTPSGAAGLFMTNGLPPKSGAPFADPCRDDAGNPAGFPRLYKSANIQLDVKFNKAGWHFPQQRISALWGDVEAFRNGTKPPEPLFFRANTNDCVTFQFTNLVPRVYALDDFQVRTPTDIMGQHIHLVKFDVLASDGAGNGWNYEDGSFAPEEVLERITAINALGGMKAFGGNSRFTLTPKPHPFFGTLGAQTTVSRWFADDVHNRGGEDRTLRTAFTHDHFGPSTHQQVGLYAGLVIEPRDSIWRNSETGQVFGNRFDGGPTSWRADILTARPDDTYREFLLEFADFQHAYKAGGGVDAQGNPVPDPPNAINPPARNEVGLPFLLERPNQCPGGAPLPCPEAISADDVGTFVLNYRNEPIPHRVVDNPNAQFPQQVAGLAGDLSHVYRSDITRFFAPMNTQPGFYPPLTKGIFDRDPYTPLLRAYEDDRVQIRVLVGAHEEGHNFGVHGIKWLFEPSDPNSGYRNNQMMGISEHFEFIIPTLPKSSIGSFADYLYQPGVAVDDQWNGLWGIMRAYNRQQPDLQPLPNNPDGHGPVISNVGDFNGVCPKTAPVRNFSVSAIAAQDSLPGGTLVYNPRTNFGGQLHDPTAIVYVRSSDLDANNQLLPGVPVEPLVLRANAGDCINLTLINKLPVQPPDLDGFNTLPMIIDRFNANQVKPSGHVGLHPQLVFFDVTRSDGTNVGFNKLQTAAPGQSVSYQWYAGDMTVRDDGFGLSTPIEFGATNLQSSDPVKHSNKGAIGALIIEPQGATWIEDSHSRASATVTAGGSSFREFVLLHQTDLNLRFGERFDDTGNHAAVPNLAEAEDPEDSGQKAFNYRTEPLWKRLGFEPDTPLEQTRDLIFTNSLTNALVGGDPATPVFTAAAGQPVRFRLLMPGGHARNSVFNLHGHIWEELPYMNNSTRLGHNPLSQWEGTRFGIGPGSHFDLLLKNGAGGRFMVRGDYLYRNQTSFLFDGGMWGIFRVQ